MFWGVLALVATFGIPLALYLMEKAGANVTSIIVIGLIALAMASLYLVLMIPWVWSSDQLAVRIWRIGLVCGISLALVSRFGIWLLWPHGKTSGGSPSPGAASIQAPAPSAASNVENTQSENLSGPGAVGSGTSDSISTVLTPSTPKGGAMTGSFTTSGRGEYEVDILGVSPEELLFNPPNKAVEKSDLPTDLIIGGHKMSIRKFTAKGFIIFDNGWKDIPITVSLVKAASPLERPKPKSQESKIKPEELSPYLLYGNKRIELHNAGSQNLWMWGFAYGDGPASIDKKESALIAPGTFYFLATDEMELKLSNALKNGEDTHLPCRFFITVGDSQEMTIRCSLWVRKNKDALTIDTRVIDTVDGWMTQAAN